MKKILMITFALSLLFMTACGNSDENKKEQVKVVYFKNDENQPWFEKMKKKYEELNPNINIVLNPLSGGDIDAYSKLALMLQSDSSIDVILEETFRLRGDVEGNKLADISDIKKWEDWGQFFDGVKKAGEVDGKIYGVPFATDVRGIFYNKKLFKQAGIVTPWQPKTWNEINIAAEKLKNTTTAVPLWLYGGMSEGTSIHTFQMLQTGTNDVLLDNNKWVLESNGFLNSLKFIDNAVKKGYTAKKSILTNPMGWQTLIEDYIPNDKIGIFIGGNYLTGHFHKYHKGVEEAFKTYGFAKMPKENGNGFTSVSGGFVLSVPEASNNKEGGLEFIKFVTSKENSIEYFKFSGELTPRKDVAESKEYKTDTIRVAATQYLSFTNFRPATSDYPGVSSAIQRAVTDVELGIKTPKQAMSDYGIEVTKIVGKDKIKSL